jgi:hypothetical protein
MLLIVFAASAGQHGTTRALVEIARAGTQSAVAGPAAFFTGQVGRAALAQQ